MSESPEIMVRSDTNSDKTEQLRALFEDVTGESTVTTHQHETRGTLTTRREIDDELESIVREMCSRYDIRTSIEIPTLATLVRLFHAGATDTEIARQLDANVSDRTVTRARINLHLFRERDFDAPFDLASFRELTTDGAALQDAVDKFDVSESTLRFYVRLLDAEQDARNANHQYQQRFSNVLAEFESTESMQPSGLADGLDDAIE
jgi:hypothetical protein